MSLKEELSTLQQGVVSLAQQLHSKVDSVLQVSSLAGRWVTIHAPVLLARLDDLTATGSENTAELESLRGSLTASVSELNDLSQVQAQVEAKLKELVVTVDATKDAGMLSSTWIVQRGDPQLTLLNAVAQTQQEQQERYDVEKQQHEMKYMEMKKFVQDLREVSVLSAAWIASEGRAAHVEKDDNAFTDKDFKTLNQNFQNTNKKLSECCQVALQQGMCM